MPSMRLWREGGGGGRVWEEGKARRSAFWRILGDDCATDYRTFFFFFFLIFINHLLTVTYNIYSTYTTLHYTTIQNTTYKL